MNRMYVIAAILATAVCWGAYGPTLHKGSLAMGHSRLRPFLCVGIAYFAIAVVVPLIVLRTSGDTGQWTIPGTWWSLAAGAAGALGALGIIFAFRFGGRPDYVMPLVFGGAPVVNAFLAIYLAGTWRQVSPIFLAGLILVAVGAMTVLASIPRPPAKPPTHEAAAAPAAKSADAANH